jgi:hypothetical protein
MRQPFGAEADAFFGDFGERIVGMLARIARQRAASEHGQPPVPDDGVLPRIAFQIGPAGFQPAGIFGVDFLGAA